MMCEQTGPEQPDRDVALAGQAGFDFTVISDHYFLWLEAHRRRALATCRIAPRDARGGRLPLTGTDEG